MRLPDIDTQRCTGCGRCVAACEPHLLSLEVVRWEKFSVLHEPDRCTGCSLCAVICPFHAITMRKAPVNRTELNTLRTARLTLEPQVAAHAEEMFQVLSDPAIYEYENEPPASLEWLRERFARLESRCSPGGSEAWLNWVIRLDSLALAGFVQASVHPTGIAAIAYELGSRYWGQGIAAEAVRAMARELASQYKVHTLSAVLKRQNHRSLRLLQRLGFSPASPEQCLQARVEADELLMLASNGHEPR